MYFHGVKLMISMMKPRDGYVFDIHIYMIRLCYEFLLDGDLT